MFPSIVMAARRVPVVVARDPSLDRMETNKKISKKEDLLLIFTRNPVLGKVKQRLAADVGQETALSVYNHLLRYTAKVSADFPGARAVYYSEEISENDIWDNRLYDKKLQHGDGLGERMQNAFSEGFELGYKRIVIIGSDLPDLTTEDLEKAFFELQISDYVIGPATDGGYYLLGMKSLTPEVFKNKNWGTEDVLAATLQDLKNKKITLLEYRNDIDRLPDLQAHPELLQTVLKK